MNNEESSSKEDVVWAITEKLQIDLQTMMSKYGDDLVALGVENVGNMMANQIAGLTASFVYSIVNDVDNIGIRDLEGTILESIRAHTDLILASLKGESSDVDITYSNSQNGAH